MRRTPTDPTPRARPAAPFVPPGRSRGPARVRRLLGVAAALGCLLVVGAPGAGATAPLSGSPNPLQARCGHQLTGSADAVSRVLDRCHETGRTLEPRYVACMREHRGAADSLEHWVDFCVDRATGGTD
jgi:hypothetical protein